MAIFHSYVAVYQRVICVLLLTLNICADCLDPR